ncbi:MAG TPA: MFS transporter [Thermoanaerobaculia bacterium]|nr:MFS transporter [Thermoanaerobaculia bacterium]
MAESSARKPRRPGTLTSLRAALTSRRIGAVTLQSFSSGLPLGLIWIALPAWLTYRGVDIKTVGLFSLAQAPWTFKFLWAPLMDRYRLPILGRKRSWMVVCQLFLLAGCVLLALLSANPRVGTVALLAVFIAFWSASQDIAIDGYAVEVLEREEQGLAVGARVALYRAATLIAGAVAITLGEKIGWSTVFWGLALLFLPLIAIVVWSPEPVVPAPPPRTLRDAVFDPLVDIFRRSRALQIIGFLLLYKFGENLATALTRPFLIQKCYAPEDVGLATATIGLVAIIIGTFFGGWMTERIGLGRALWIFGGIQAVGFLGYVAVDRLTPGAPCAGGAHPLGWEQPFSHRMTMYGAVAIENACQAMATGAFGVLLLRLTQKQFSATQYALFSSIFALGRTLAGPPAGYLVDALGWTPFFLVSTLASIPGLVLLQRFSPLGLREPEITDASPVERRPVTRATLMGQAFAGTVVGTLLASAISALLAALKAVRAKPGTPLDFAGEIARLFSPASPSGWLRVAGVVVAGLLCGSAVAAFVAARHGVRATAAGRTR